MKYFTVTFLAVAITLSSSIISTTIAAELDIQRDVYNVSTLGISPRIVNGQLANVGQYPYFIYITGYRLLDILTSAYSYCGGALISSHWVVTAAHCLVLQTPPLNILMILNSFRLEAGTVLAGALGATGQARSVLASNVHPHDRYNPVTLLNDIGVIKTPTGFVITTAVRVIPLPPPFETTSRVNQVLTVMGYGRTETGATSSRLRGAQLTVTTNSDCRGPSLQQNTFFCAQDNTAPISAICDGDSGGPGTLQISNVETLYGIIIFGGSPCGSTPQGFTKISEFVTWIWAMQQVHGLN